MSAQTILLVEDDPDIRDGVRILLAGEGYHILEAENGAKALEVFGPEVDLVILDVMMPGMSGLRVCEKLRKSSTVPERQDLNHEGQAAPFYDWTPRAPVFFTDGQLDAVLYCDVLRANAMLATRMLTLGCIALFLGVFLLGCRRIVRYICLLSEEIQAMEGGDLDHPVTVQGADELTTLASCLDSMRKTLNRQHQEKAEADARVKNLITEMSHDLRTPLTTLLLYTEIVRDGRYDGQAQLQEYLAKIDTKARQIKQMSDNLFEYALVTRDAPADMDPPARFSQIFEEPLADMAEQLQQHGFACALRLGGEDVVLTVRGQYVRRVLDNIASNLLKYADPSQPVEVDYVRDETRAGLSFANQALPEAPGTDRTRVGLESVQAMMARMQADVRVEREPGHYRITLLFPITQE